MHLFFFRSKRHNKNVSWLRKTEYISTEYNRFTPLANKAESRVGFNIKKYFKEEDIYKDRESQLQAIEDTFESVKAPVSYFCLNGTVFTYPI